MARNFFNDVLGLKIVYDPGYACVWQVGEKGFVGAVDVRQGSIEVKARGGVLVSLTVNNVDEVYERLREYRVEDLSPIQIGETVPVKSCFFTGPEGYKFEIQEFTDPKLIETF
jgi:catechol 2,3-dioxygenase-like lactoylglutathione lyase family enzyme